MERGHRQAHEYYFYRLETHLCRRRPGCYPQQHGCRRKPTLLSLLLRQHPPRFHRRRRRWSSWYWLKSSHRPSWAEQRHRPTSFLSSQYPDHRACLTRIVRSQRPLEFRESPYSPESRLPHLYRPAPPRPQMGHHPIRLGKRFVAYSDRWPTDSQH